MPVYYDPPIDRETLYHEYCVEKISTPKLAVKYGVTAIIMDSWLKKLDIPIRNHKEAAMVMWDKDRQRKPKISELPEPIKPYKDAVVLYSLYWNENKTTREIGEMYGVKEACISYWFRKLGVPVRTLSERSSSGNKKRTFVQNKITVKCAWCGKEKEVWPYRLNETNDFYCSPKCKAEHWSETYTGENAHNWQGGEWTKRVSVTQRGKFRKLRRQVLERDGYTCAMCGSSKKLIIHHITPMKEDPELKLAYDTNNLITLCSDCHNYKVNQHEDEYKQLFTDIIAKTVNCWNPLRASMPQQG